MSPPDAGLFVARCVGRGGVLVAVRGLLHVRLKKVVLRQAWTTAVMEDILRGLRRMTGLVSLDMTGVTTDSAMEAVGTHCLGND